MSFFRKNLGATGEELAKNFLIDLGYEIIGTNIRYKFGEIDILARNGEYIVIVEVKTKTNFNQGRPEEEVDYFKKKKLLLLARAIEQKYKENYIRIDVVAVDKTSDIPKINHIINAVEG